MIVKSLADTDMYVFTMQQAALHQVPDTQVRFEFNCRTRGAGLAKLESRVRDEIESMGDLSFTKDELDFIGSLRFVKRDYVDFLRMFRPNPKDVTVWVDDAGELRVSAKGSWVHNIIWEVPVLAIVSELNSEMQSGESEPMGDPAIQKRKLDLFEMRAPKEFKFSEFGTRRRLSRKWQEQVVKDLKRACGDHLVGTSNVLLAMENGLTPIGTMAHQWIMAGQGMRQTRLAHHQKYMLELWTQEYRGDLGYALTDTITLDAFLHDFDLFLAKLYDAGRIDSGDPDIGIEKLVNHYRALRIDPKTKTAIPSDDLDFEKGFGLCERWNDKINVSCGIGTYLTNKCRDDVKPVSIVMKMASCNGSPVAKISDEPGKAMCEDAGYLQYLKSVFNVN
ncbi:MAG: nicotinate phosphoribosyltransferase [Armatimonadetes bacterium]|nr:nicotinate phosphoribosyltransferase [Armatimonadota bacterium]